MPPHIRAALADHLERHVGKSSDALLWPPERGGCHLDGKVFRDSYFVPALDRLGRDSISPAPANDPRLAALRRHIGGEGRQPPRDDGPPRSQHRECEPAYQSIAAGRDAEVAAALSKLAAPAAD